MNKKEQKQSPVSDEMQPPEGDEIGGGEVAAVVSTAGIEAMTRAEIDIAIATAKKYPRSIAKFLKGATDMAICDEETAESCIYCREVGEKWNPVTKKREKEYAEGYSIRLAEIAVANYQNIRYGSMITEMTPEFVRARGVCQDLENNVTGAAEVVESTLKKDGKTPYTPRMRIVVAKAAAAKAIRDAVWKVIPPALLKPVERQVREIVGGSASILTLTARRQRALSWLSKLNIDLARVWTALGIQGEGDLSSDVLVRLVGIKTAIHDGDMKADDAFPPIPQEMQPGKRTIGKPAPESEQPKAEGGAPTPTATASAEGAGGSGEATSGADEKPPASEKGNGKKKEETPDYYADTKEGISNAKSPAALKSLETLFWGKYAPKMPASKCDELSKAFADRLRELKGGE